MFAFVDVSVLLLAMGLARAGWRRGLVSHAVDLLGFAVALLAAVRLHRPPALAWSLVGLSDGWAGIAGGLTIFVPLIVVVAIVGSKLGRVASKPGLRMTDRVLGAGFGVAWAGVMLTCLMLVADLAPVPPLLTDAVERSPTARWLLSYSAPTARLLEGALGSEGDRLFGDRPPTAPEDEGTSANAPTVGD